MKEDIDETEEVKVLTLTELVAAIGDKIKSIGGNVSDLRKESVESHLRLALQLLGFKPRETKESLADIPELQAQLAASLESVNGKAPDKGIHKHIHMHLSATLSNVTAEVGMKIAPALKEAPAPKTAAATGGRAALLEKYGKLGKKDLLDLRASAVEVLATAPERTDAQEIKSVAEELLKKF